MHPDIYSTMISLHIFTICQIFKKRGCSKAKGSQNPLALRACTRAYITLLISSVEFINNKLMVSMFTLLTRQQSLVQQRQRSLRPHLPDEFTFSDSLFPTCLRKQLLSLCKPGSGEGSLWRFCCDLERIHFWPAVSYLAS